LKKNQKKIKYVNINIIEGETEMKRSTIFFTLVLLLAFMFSLSACSSKIESISVNDEIVNAAVEDGKVEIGELKLTLNLKNGTKESKLLLSLDV
jgi:hypothetical protein